MNFVNIKGKLYRIFWIQPESFSANTKPEVCVVKPLPRSSRGISNFAFIRHWVRHRSFLNGILTPATSFSVFFQLVLQKIWIHVICLFIITQTSSQSIRASSFRDSLLKAFLRLATFCFIRASHFFMISCSAKSDDRWKEVTKEGDGNIMTTISLYCCVVCLTRKSILPV
jgi:hypothetical protein